MVRFDICASSYYAFMHCPNILCTCIYVVYAFMYVCMCVYVCRCMCVLVGSSYMC